MAKVSALELEVNFEKKMLKIRMKEQLQEAQKNLTITMRNLEQHDVTPYDLNEHTGLLNLESFKILVCQYNKLDNILHEVRIRRRDRHQSKSSRVRTPPAP